MISMLQQLKNKKKQKERCTVYESIYSCYEQYRYGAVLYVLSIISFNYNILIDLMTGYPEHGKDVVDDVNTCDKRYLMGK